MVRTPRAPLLTMSRAAMDLVPRPCFALAEGARLGPGQISGLGRERPSVHTCRPVAGSAEGAGGERGMIVRTKATELAVAAGAAMLVAGGWGEAVLAVVRACGAA
jgi:hypothetical protein